MEQSKQRNTRKKQKQKNTREMNQIISNSNACLYFSYIVSMCHSLGWSKYEETMGNVNQQVKKQFSFELTRILYIETWLDCKSFNIQCILLSHFLFVCLILMLFFVVCCFLSSYLLLVYHVVLLIWHQEIFMKKLINKLKMPKEILKNGNKQTEIFKCMMIVRWHACLYQLQTMSFVNFYYHCCAWFNHFIEFCFLLHCLLCFLVV